MQKKDALVLSIQSHVVHGRSGNRSAVFPLELNGIDTDPLNTVHYSAHTAYPHRRGTVMDLQQFKDIIEGLQLNEILPTYTHVLTGYIANPAIIKEIANLRKTLGSDVHMFVDPVLGDCGKLYVSEDCYRAMKDSLVPVADTITPNAYEAEWLSNIKMTDQKSLLEAVRAMHSMGPKNVIITSTEWKRRFAFFSWDNGSTQFAIETDTFQRKFDGPGDVFAALLLANMVKYPGDYENIATRTVNSVFSVLKKTVDLNARELALTKSVEEILNPPNTYRPISLSQFLAINISIEKN